MRTAPTLYIKHLRVQNSQTRWHYLSVVLFMTLSVCVPISELLNEHFSCMFSYFFFIFHIYCTQQKSEVNFKRASTPLKFYV